MIIIPYKVNPSQYSVFIALEAQNILRMQNYDPIQLTPERFGPPFTSLALRHIIVGFVSEDDRQQFQTMTHDKLEGMLQHLSKGWKSRPPSGGNDDKPYPMK